MDNSDWTNGSYSENESCSDSDEGREHGVEKPTPNVGKPWESVTPNVQLQEESEVSKPPQTPGQGPSLDVLTEIRKIIKEEYIKSLIARGKHRQRLGPAAHSTGSSKHAPHPVGPTQESPKELSAIDRKWGILFDQNGVPTKRWEQVIGGICNYLMAEYMPQNSLVVTPEKMAAFYLHHKLDVEVFPFAEIFRNRRDVPPVRLAELYQQLACEYYLVPAEPKARPTVPGLTLAGWTRWMTLVTRAYPTEEAQRLGKVVAALPINADSLLDGKPERLPKQISRHLLPEQPDRESRAAVKDALRAHFEAIQQFPSRKTPSSANPPNPNSDSERRAEATIATSIITTIIADGQPTATATEVTGVIVTVLATSAHTEAAARLTVTRPREESHVVEPAAAAAVFVIVVMVVVRRAGEG
ncbi:hypothetical protein VTG60DRAFT_7139 [Thermothelomyces hinnuleus]